MCNKYIKFNRHCNRNSPTLRLSTPTLPWRSLSSACCFESTSSSDRTASSRTRTSRSTASSWTGLKFYRLEYFTYFHLFIFATCYPFSSTEDSQLQNTFDLKTKRCNICISKIIKVSWNNWSFQRINQKFYFFSLQDGGGFRHQRDLTQVIGI